MGKGHRVKHSEILTPVLAFLLPDIQSLQALLASQDGFRHQMLVGMCPDAVCIAWFHAHLGNEHTSAQCSSWYGITVKEFQEAQVKMPPFRLTLTSLFFSNKSNAYFTPI